MQHPTTTLPLTIGLDLGSRSTQCAVYSPDGKRIEERKIATTRARLQALLERFRGARLVMEASTPARWIKDLAVELGQVRPQLLNPVELRGSRFQEVRTQLFARAQLVRQRTSLVNFVRSEVKAVGESLPSCSTRSFASKARALVPEALKEALGPIFEMIQSATKAIEVYDRRIEQLSADSFPQTRLLRQVHGVGPLVALGFVATIGTPQRFSKSRMVGPYLGLVPRLNQSGKHDPALGITKCGDHFMRSLLVSAATRIIGPHGTDSDLRRFGLQIASSGGKRAKARARVAVARKLAVVMHRLLATGEAYEPLRGSTDIAA